MCVFFCFRSGLSLIARRIAPSNIYFFIKFYIFILYFNILYCIIVIILLLLINISLLLSTYTHTHTHNKCITHILINFIYFN